MICALRESLEGFPSRTTSGFEKNGHGMSSSESADKRFPRALYSRGTEPDPRFSLANERTFLAWIRTSLALLAVGVAVEALPLPIQAELRFAAAVVFVLMGLLAAVQSWVGWYRTEQSMRVNRVLSGPTVSVVLAVGVVFGGSLLVVGLFL